MAERSPITFQTNRLTTIYRRFLNICYQLQVMRGNDYIVLPVDRLGQILGVNPRRVSDYRVFAQDEAFLHEIAKSCYSRNGGVATKFRFTCRFVNGVAVAPEVKNPTRRNLSFDPSCSSESKNHSNHSGRGG
jgi:hypothetical protein